MDAVLVIGGGFMGAGIAQVCAQAGYRVYLTDKDNNALGRAMKTILWSVEKLESKGLIRETAPKIMDRLSVEPESKGLPKFNGLSKLSLKMSP